MGIRTRWSGLGLQLLANIGARELGTSPHMDEWALPPCFPIEWFHVKDTPGEQKKSWLFKPLILTRTKGPTMKFPCEDQNIQAVRNQSPGNFPNYQSKTFYPFSNLCFAAISAQNMDSFAEPQCLWMQFFIQQNVLGWHHEWSWHAPTMLRKGSGDISDFTWCLFSEPF